MDSSKATFEESSDRNIGAELRPARMVFCTHWSVRDAIVTINDEFESIELDAVPFVVGESRDLFVGIIWEGYAAGIKPLLTIDTPSGARIEVRLPSLKRYFPVQAQMNSLKGFCFSMRGVYRFRVSVGSIALEKDLHVV